MIKSRLTNLTSHTRQNTTRQTDTNTQPDRQTQTTEMSKSSWTNLTSHTLQVGLLYFGMLGPHDLTTRQTNRHTTRQTDTNNRDVQEQLDQSYLPYSSGWLVVCSRACLAHMILPLDRQTDTQPDRQTQTTEMSKSSWTNLTSHTLQVGLLYFGMLGPHDLTTRQTNRHTTRQTDTNNRDVQEQLDQSYLPYSSGWLVVFRHAWPT